VTTKTTNSLICRAIGLIIFYFKTEMTIKLGSYQTYSIAHAKVIKTGNDLGCYLGRKVATNET